jgi:hypothetical protein
VGTLRDTDREREIRDMINRLIHRITLEDIAEICTMSHEEITEIYEAKRLVLDGFWFLAATWLRLDQETKELVETFIRKSKKIELEATDQDLLDLMAQFNSTRDLTSSQVLCELELN